MCLWATNVAVESMCLSMMRVAECIASLNEQCGAVAVEYPYMMSEAVCMASLIRPREAVRWVCLWKWCVAERLARLSA